ncbi:hypothetical protein HZS55_02950 [Halosimplex rubrum]|uniref:Uncharacterized protein n=1 Tax=Halosimplex rubrum TaxID=869889 RepID=A0A7D5NYB0_9EURY|nr:hypothetical protein [Halosimplex rubrum]QLH76323.1 hypothetical protein HZS55_02950 [Halosimplex rubrum]
MDGGILAKLLSPLLRLGQILVGRFKRGSLGVTSTRGIALYGSDFAEKEVLSAVYRARVENFGRKTVYNCTPKLRLTGTRESDDSDTEITVDTTCVWARENSNESIDLIGGEAEWVEVFRLIQDYSAGRGFDPESDFKVIFPAAGGWSEPSRIQIHNLGLDTPTTETELTKQTIEDTQWDEAIIEVRGEDPDGEVVQTQYSLDLEDMSTQLDNRILWHLED